jgi:hypothetical protein
MRARELPFEVSTMDRVKRFCIERKDVYQPVTIIIGWIFLFVRLK